MRDVPQFSANLRALQAPTRKPSSKEERSDIKVMALLSFAVDKKALTAQ